MDEIGADFVVEGLVKKVTLGEKISLIKELATQDNCQALADNVREVKSLIRDGGFSVVLVTGKSGLISERLLNSGHNPIQATWVMKDGGTRPGLLTAILDRKNFEPSTAIAIVDDVMGSGEKAEEFLSVLKGAGFERFSFISIVGPREYCSGKVSDVEAAKLAVLEKDASLASNLFFPERKSGAEWELMSGLERIADFYGSSGLAKSCLDSTLTQIISIDI